MWFCLRGVMKLSASDNLLRTVCNVFIRELCSCVSPHIDPAVRH